MRLCIATPLYPPEGGGPATYTRILETELPKHGIEVVLVKFRDVRRYPKLFRHIAYYFAVRRAGKKADVILALDPVSTGFPALLAAQVLHKPFVVKIVGDYAWEQGSQRFGITDTLDQFVRKGRVPFPVAALRAVQTHVARSATRVIVPSEYLKGIVATWGESHGKGSIPASRIEVIYNAMQAETAGILPKSLETLTRPRVVTIGRLVPWKHVDGVIEAVAGLKMPATLIIGGEGPEGPRLKARALEALGDRAVFTGGLTHPEVLAVIADADLFVLNSSYEGLSHLLIEALSLGTPTIATKVGGNPELIEDGENGMLVPAGDTSALTKAIERVLGDSALRDRIAEHAKKTASIFTEDAMIRKTAALLTTLV